MHKLDLKSEEFESLISGDDPKRVASGIINKYSGGEPLDNPDLQLSLLDSLLLGGE